MKPFSQFPDRFCRQVKYLLTDLDDTLTLNGRLPAAAYSALEALQEAGIAVIPITGRPAGWCDHLARMWPVSAVVGENGAFYFLYDQAARRMIRRYWQPESVRRENKARLHLLQQDILRQVPGCRISADQAYREADLAVDFSEDVLPLPKQDIDTIVSLFKTAGATAKISSIHVNGWFGDFDKLAMTRLLFEEAFNTPLEQAKDSIIFSGDSPNDAPMFEYFPHSVGVANIQEFSADLKKLPAWITRQPGGLGFAELVRHLLSHI